MNLNGKSLVCLIALCLIASASQAQTAATNRQSPPDPRRPVSRKGPAEFRFRWLENNRFIEARLKATPAQQTQFTALNNKYEQIMSSTVQLKLPKAQILDRMRQAELGYHGELMKILTKDQRRTYSRMWNDWKRRPSATARAHTGRG